MESCTARLRRRFEKLPVFTWVDLKPTFLKCPEEWHGGLQVDVSYNSKDPPDTDSFTLLLYTMDRKIFSAITADNGFSKNN